MRENPNQATVGEAQFCLDQIVSEPEKDSISDMQEICMTTRNKKEQATETVSHTSQTQVDDATTQGKDKKENLCSVVRKMQHSQMVFRK